MDAQHYQTHVFTVYTSSRALDSDDTLHECIEALIRVGGFTKLDELSHRFHPQGFTMIALLSESHIALHTWPEDGIAKVVIATCKDEVAPIAAYESALIDHLDGTRVIHQEAR